MWGRKRNTEQLPWYRSPDYRGHMTEDHKRQLDAFRMKERHPASQLENLPQEVQSYIGRLELELYDFKQERAFNNALIPSFAGAALLYVSHYGIARSDSVWPYIFGPFLLVVPWLFYHFAWKRNASELWPDDPAAPSSTDELIKREWELNCVVDLKQDERDNARA